MKDDNKTEYLVRFDLLLPEFENPMNIAITFLFFNLAWLLGTG